MNKSIQTVNNIHLTHVNSGQRVRVTCEHMEGRTEKTLSMRG